MAGHDYHTADDVMKASGQDFGLCSNGSRVLVNGGAVKGNKKNFLIVFYSLKFKFKTSIRLNFFLNRRGCLAVYKRNGNRH